MTIALVSSLIAVWAAPAGAGPASPPTSEDLDGDGRADPGPGTTRRTFRLQLGMPNIQRSPVGAWLYDAKEFASGVTFNPGTLEAVTLAKA